jgi:hypothetical protein
LDAAAPVRTVSSERWWPHGRPLGAGGALGAVADGVVVDGVVVELPLPLAALAIP